MINLLPPAEKQAHFYARRNVFLLKWLIVMVIAFSGIGGVIFAGSIYIDSTAKTYNKEIDTLKASLANSELNETANRTQQISNNIKLALQVLSNQVLFSPFLKQAGAVMPAGSSLQSLSIGKLEGGLDLQAVAIDYQTATQVQVNLADPSNKIFDKVDIVNINCGLGDINDPRYPCRITLRALFAKDSPLIFANKQSAGDSND